MGSSKERKEHRNPRITDWVSCKEELSPAVTAIPKDSKTAVEIVLLVNKLHGVIIALEYISMFWNDTKVVYIRKPGKMMKDINEQIYQRYYDNSLSPKSQSTRRLDK